jgi:hypothetical protein
MTVPNLHLVQLSLPQTTQQFKDGWKTSEFWLTAASQLIAVLVFMRAMPSSDATTIQGALAQFIPAAAVAISSGAGLVAYTISRFKAKATTAPVVVPVVTPSPLPTPPAFTPGPVSPQSPPRNPVVLPANPEPIPMPVPPAFTPGPPVLPWTPDPTENVLR